MSSPDVRALLKNAILRIDDLEQRLASHQAEGTAPIAVLGIGCRFPAGGTDPESFWQALETGVDGVRRIGPDRWPADALPADRLEVRWAGLLDSVDRFDAAFFGISPREATRLDPQQRLLLEVTWEALEHAGQKIDGLFGSQTGVFVGMMSADYGQIVRDAGDYDMYSGIGNAHSTAAGRIAYTLGLHGPCLTVDTACSSSLVATHLACQSLRQKESDLAIVAGVNVILDPMGMAMLIETQAISPDGRCKTFDAAANGFVRGEGCGVVILKRLADAERDGDPIMAVIRGSVVNQDGRSTGMTAPNVLSQQAMLLRALKVTRLRPEDIGYVETHGTGTSLGDPIEFEALREVLGKPRADGSTCVLGALKTNVGHTEAAAGIGALIKAVLCLHHEAIPKNLHFKTLNPRISLEGTPFVIPTETIPWKANGKPRRAGVSSFGISGTNAHVILEEASRREEMPFQEASSYLLSLSARTPEALAAMAKAYQEWLVQNDEPLHHVAYTASLRRSNLDHRLGVVGSTRDEIAAALGAFAASELTPGVVTRKAAQTAPKVVFVFPGQGSQWVGMGRQLYREEPVFRDALSACDKAIRKEADFSIIEELDKPEETSRIHETIVAQPALFAMEVSLAALLQSWGMVPAAVVGHSVGEVAAAYVAGMLDLTQAAQLVSIRARVMQKATGHGKMVSVALAEDDAQKSIAGLEDRVGIAAVNDFDSVVLSGDIETIDSLVQKFAQCGVQTRPLRVNYAFHSPQMEPLLVEFKEALGDFAGKPGTISMISTVTATAIADKPIDITYWAQNIRQTVRFAEAIASLSSNDHCVFVEVGPHPVLALSMEQTLTTKNLEGNVLSTLRREKDERKNALMALGALHTLGVAVDWKRLYPENGKVVELPTYPWQRERYWVDASRMDRVPPRHQTDSLADLFYSVAWRPAPELPESSTNSPGVCVIFMDSTGVGTSLVTRLEAIGLTCLKVFLGDSFAQVDRLSYRIDPSNADDYVSVLVDATAEGLSCIAVIHLWSLDTTPFDAANTNTIDADLVTGTLSAAFLTKALALRTWHKRPKICLVTRSGQIVDDGDSAVSVFQAPLWGLARTITLEHPELRAVCMDLPYAIEDFDIVRLVREVTAENGETQIALRPNGRYLPQLVQQNIVATPLESIFHAELTYLITGGLSGQGLALAQWMVNHGARNIALVSRRAPSEQTQKAIVAMEQAGVRIVVISADVSNANDVAQMMNVIAERLPPLRGIVHAAGITGESVLVPEITRESFLDVAASKVRGGWNLHEATRNLALDFFVMYSSAASILGLLGGAGYAAANAFLDGLAFARRHVGLPALSVQWGLLGEVGMISLREGATSIGALDAMTLSEVHGALGRLFAAQQTAMSVMRISVARHVDLFPQLAGNSFWSALQGQAPMKPTNDEGLAIASHFLEKLRTAHPSRRKELLTTRLRNMLGSILHIAPERIPFGATFHSLGMDSVMSLELRKKIEAELGTRISIKDILASGGLDNLVVAVENQMGLGDEVIPTNLSPGSWIVVPRPNPDAKIRLICFPYAGGNASIYTPWAAVLSPEIEVCAIQPPGRQERIHEAFMHNIEEMVRAIVSALLPCLDKPFAMFGHCFGAIIMFEVMRVLRDQHGLVPVHLFPSGSPAPGAYFVSRLVHRSHEQFVDLLRSIGFGSTNVLDDAEAVHDLIPPVRNDFDVAAEYSYTHCSAFDIPITTFAGHQDGFAPPNTVLQWQRYTANRFDPIVFPGEHYFIVPERETVLRIVREEVLGHLARIEQHRQSGQWLLPSPRSSEPRMRLFCFPGFCQSSAAFADWSALLPEDIEVVIVERPGRGSRVDEMPLGTINDVVELLMPAIDGILDRPFAFCGLNNGSILMYELTRRLRRHGKPLPRHLFVGAAMAPQVYMMPSLHHLTTARIMEFIATTGGSLTPGLPERTIRADCAVAVSYADPNDEPLDIPIHAFAGDRDGFVPVQAVRLWNRQTKASFEMHIVPGEHDIVSKPSAEMIDVIRKTLVS